MNYKVINYLLKLAYDYPDIKYLVEYIIEHPHKFDSLIYQIKLKLAEDAAIKAIYNYFNS